MTADTSTTDWEAELAGLLSELTSVQDELLALLSRKRKQMMQPETVSLQQADEEENRLCQRLEACQQRRQQLLSAAESEGMPSASIQQLTGSLKSIDENRRQQIGDQVRQASARMRLVQHHSLTNWVLAQRSLLHLTQMLEIVATGGRLKPTYGDLSSAHGSGSLVDRAA